MPTENRSSNTELISQAAAAIEDLLANGTGAIAAGSWASLPAELRKLTAPAAPQPNPEPIAWMVGTAFWWTKEEAERDAAETGLPIVGLGPMNDVGEAARLRVELGHMREERDDLSAKLDRFYSRTHGIKNLAVIEELSDKLAERDALLRDFLEVATGGFSDSDHVLRVRRHLETFLSASAEPEAT
ncbi:MULTISPECIES: hypothetical protein [unclassified Pseudomonas]|uniref:hypothetical protein n=1 Tax=unclassified Pseudomonas TaxID=196821 RepID=UPI00067B36BF|nr:MULTISPECIES: hypothetical protein [unclassified Pseudomonas]RAS34070.1 hypothetical protein H040_00193 [Pseudomonas sp. URMO17WK12:I7]SME90918.1 hypothetical protein SAMN02745903_00193 [Pseudomonas sp. URMO17WK12:I5]